MGEMLITVEADLEQTELLVLWGRCRRDQPDASAAHGPHGEKRMGRHDLSAGCRCMALDM